MSLTSAVIFDLIFLAVLIVVVIKYARRGFMAGLVQFIGNLVSLLGALFLSGEAAAVLFERFFKNSFIDRIDTTIAQQGSVDLSQIVNRFAGFLPESIQQKLVDTAGSFLDFAAPDVAERIVKDVVQPLVTPIIAIVVFFVSFALCRLLVSFIVAVLTNLNRIPVLGGVNRLLGVVMGALAGSVDLYIALCAVWALIIITNGSIPFLNEQALSASIFYKIFSGLNPFV